MTTTWVPADTFGNRLRLLRMECGYTAEQLAAQCGVTVQAWYAWERGTRPRGMDKIVAILASNTGIDRDWLMWGGPLSASEQVISSPRWSMGAVNAA